MRPRIARKGTLCRLSLGLIAAGSRHLVGCEQGHSTGSEYAKPERKMLTTPMARKVVAETSNNTLALWSTSVLAAISERAAAPLTLEFSLVPQAVGLHLICGFETLETLGDRCQGRHLYLEGVNQLGVDFTVELKLCQLHRYRH